ncbi:hypothetical protein DKG34_39095 [Streptomyces sp. NWU49]|uniref:hypothetical protein n=1 Tax=Streptomyces sp. NWU49 TaxID=2201153 RepID=UPI000D683B2E|nr:hypothetical protein [Streptomyces sp. NWU49]PWJ02352.1 hypothetical protein DKG34_39095 [Streptomyces sp. NWU49]
MFTTAWGVIRMRGVLGDVRPARTAIDVLMGTIDRQQPVGEAQFAILEAALQLLRLDELSSSGVDVDEIKLLREALGATRAAVLATQYALVRAIDARRMFCPDNVPVDLRDPATPLHATSAECD